jgi:heat shock protein HtpX
MESWLIFAAMLGVFAVAAVLLLGPLGLLVLGGALGVFFGMGRQASSGVVPHDMARVGELEAPELYRIARTLAERAGLSRVPSIYISRSPMLNAAAFGSAQAPGLMVTVPLYRQLSERELAGVLAHEISHIRNNDLAIFRLANTIRSLTSAVANGFWLMVLLYFPVLLVAQTAISLQAFVVLLLAPTVSVFLQLALYRIREFGADMTAVELTGDPEALAMALRKIDYAGRGILRQLFPVPRRDSSSLLRTHPSTEKRVERLLQLDYAHRRRERSTLHAS